MFNSRAGCQTHGITMKRIFLWAIAALLAAPMVARAAELTPGEAALKQQLGPGTPDPVPLWTGKPPALRGERAA
jgi:hypothetical protein